DDIVLHRGRAREVVERLEQRYDLERGDTTAGGVTRQLVDGGDVAGAAREADHVSAAAVEAVTRLQRRHHAERVQHLPGGRGHSAGPDLAKRRFVDAAVLPDLELREVEAERLSLPDKV